MKFCTVGHHITKPFLLLKKFIRTHGLYRCLNLAVSGIASIAAVATAVVSWRTMNVNIAERSEVDALQKESLRLRDRLDEAFSRVDLYSDIIAAEGGDRWAYIRAIDRLIKYTNNFDRAEFLLTRLDDSIRKYSGKPEEHLLLKHVMFDPQMVENDDAQVVALLKSPLYDDRLRAVNSIYRRRLNRLIPELFDLLEHDPYLAVVQYAFHTILRSIGSSALHSIHTGDIDVTDFNHVIQCPDLTKGKLADIWNRNKARILSQHPLRVEVFKPKDEHYAPLFYLHDEQSNKNYTFPTETEESIPLLFDSTQSQ